MRIFLTIFVLILSLSCLIYADETSLLLFNDQRNSLNEKAMMTLGGWAVANIALNAALYSRTSNHNRKYFYQMNVAWNIVNAAIAGFGYYGAINPDTSLSLYESLREQTKIENILLFNAGLDIGYVMTGFFLMEKSKNSINHAPRLKGYGHSLMLQGGFLFLFDVVLFFLHNNNHKLASGLLSALSFDYQKIVVSIHF